MSSGQAPIIGTPTSQPIITVLPSGVTSAQINAHTIQAMTEIVYVREGNDMVASNLASLQSSLSTTQNVLQTLTGLQNAHNDITVPNPGGIIFSHWSAHYPTSLFDLGTNVDQYQGGYVKDASAYFGSGIVPVIPSGFGIIYLPGNSYTQPDGTVVSSPPTPVGLTPQAQSAVNQLIKLKSTLATEISTLYRMTPAADRSTPGSLLANCQIVYNDIPSSITSTQNVVGQFQALSKWLQDGYTAANSPSGVSGAGKLQQDITNAITSGENLNDSQQQSVQQYLYFFQQYYQSASSILTTLTQIIQQMAQHIAQ